MNDIIVYRENQLTESDLKKLDTLVEEKLNIKPKFIRVVKSRVDEYGDTVEYADWVECGIEILPRGELPERFLESIQRKTRKQNIALYLHKLESFKRFGRDATVWRTVVSGLCDDMAEFSEYAIAKTCETLRLRVGSPFFPDPSEIVKMAKELDWSMKNISFRDSYTKKEQKIIYETNVRTTKSKRRVSLLLKFAMKSKLSRWEEKWMKAYKGKTYEGKI